MSEMTRRTFVTTTAGAFSGLYFLPKSVKGANERIRMAVCGLNGRGGSHLSGFATQPDTEVAYLVDPDSNVLARRLKDCEKKGWPKPKAVDDVRKALEDPDLNGVSIATPHQHHALITIWACQAGKHVYVEKPCSHTVFDGRVAVTASYKYNTIVQHGTQQRSSHGRCDQMKAINDGQFGKLVLSHGYACKPRGGIGHKPIEPVPDNLNWDVWRGPAMIPDDGFHRNFVHYNWHWFWITGNGEIGNQGVHQMDVARWAVNKPYPKRVMSIGGRFAWKDQGQTPNTQFTVMDFGDDQWLFFNVRNYKHPNYKTQLKNDFYFEDCRIVDNKLYRNGSNEPEKVEYPRAKITDGGCFGSFIKTIRAGKRELCNADILVAHYSSALGHIGNISYRLGAPVPFSAKQKAFGDNKLAAEAFERLHDLLKDDAALPVDKTEYLCGPWLEFDAETERFVAGEGDMSWARNRSVYTLNPALMDSGDDTVAMANALLRDPCRKGYEVPEPDEV